MTATTDIFSAVSAGDLDALRAMLAADPSLARARNAEGLSIVLHARYRFQLDALAALLATGPVLDIFEAAAVGDTARVAALLAADPALALAYAGDGFTALQLAAFFGQPEAVRVLLAAGADVAAVAHNPMRVQPLHAALAGRHAAVAAVLVAAGAPVNAAQHGGYTPLHEAAEHGDRALVELLLAAGADRTLTRDDGQTAADVAAAGGHAELAALLRGA